MKTSPRPTLLEWPIRYRPLEDELLSSWLVRLSHGLGLKVQTLCNLEFGQQRQVWNRDIDRLGPSWLIETLSQRTGTPLATARKTSIRCYDGVLYRRFKSSGILPWVTRLKMFHRTWQGNGLMFCPACLTEGKTPYYRKSWRIAMNTVCLRHRCMLQDRCPMCKAGVAFTRTDLGNPGMVDFPDLNLCHACAFDLATASRQPPPCLDRDAAAWLAELWRDFAAGDFDASTLEQIEMLHVTCALLMRRRSKLHLAEYVCERMGVVTPQFGPGRVSIESQPVDVRHQVLQLAAWLMIDLPARLSEAVRAHALLYNHLTRDFRSLPTSYRKVAMSIPHRDW